MNTKFILKKSENCKITVIWEEKMPSRHPPNIREERECIS